MNANERAVLEAVVAAEAEIAARPEPPAYRRWERDDLRALREYGPAYSPASWFCEGQTLTPAVSARYLRASRGLAAAGLVVLTHSAGGRLQHIAITAAGRAALAAEAPENPVGGIPPTETVAAVGA